MKRLGIVLLIGVLGSYVAYALSGKRDAATTAIAFDDFTTGKLLADCGGDRIAICNTAGEEIAVGWTSGAAPPASTSAGIKAYMPTGLCRVFPGSFNYTDVYIQVTGSASASAGTVTGDCR